MKATPNKIPTLACCMQYMNSWLSLAAPMRRRYVIARCGPGGMGPIQSCVTAEHRPDGFEQKRRMLPRSARLLVV